jgi:F0F1-type ATP synthase membrane subunit b/b'
MLKWLGRRREGVKERKDLPSVRSILERAVADAEQIVANIKMKAQAEAEEEAARIIAHARKEAEEIKRRAEAVAERGVESTSVVAEEEKRGEEPFQPQYEAPAEEKKEALAEPVSVQEEPSPPPPPEKSRDKEPELIGRNSHSLYTGEVELAIAKPVDLKMMSKLYTYLQATPEIKLVRTNGSWERGTTITITLDKPIPLISVLSTRIPEAKVTPERPEMDGFVRGKRGVRRIKLARKEE